LTDGHVGCFSGKGKCSRRYPEARGRFKATGSASVAVLPLFVVNQGAIASADSCCRADPVAGDRSCGIGRLDV
jgi:hypothetical protein